MIHQRCSICSAPGTHHAYAEIKLSLTSPPRRINDIVTCLRHLDDVTHALKKNHLSSPYTSVFSDRLDGVVEERYPLDAR